MVERADDDLAVLLFTSGTAGLPRAAMLTHGNLRANIDQIRATTASGAVDPAATADDVALGVIPLFHIFGLNAVLGLALTVGATVVLVERFDPPAALALLAEHGITVVSGVPTMWRAWADLPSPGADGANPMAGLRLGVSGAAALDPDLRRAISARYRRPAGRGLWPDRGLAGGHQRGGSPGARRQHRRAAARCARCA